MKPTTDIQNRVTAELRELDRAGTFRTLKAPSGVDLSSNDYLDLAGHPHLIRRLQDALSDGCGSTGSRLLRGHRDVFTSLETTFATLKRCEASLFFSSGYLANLAVLSTLPRRGDALFCDHGNHASLRDGARLSQARRTAFRHNDVDALRRLLKQCQEPGDRYVVVESLHSMDGDIAPLRDYAAVCREAGALLIVDEAHAVGVFGARGSGLVEELGIEDDVFVSVNSAGKALGVAGAFVAGARWTIDYLIQRARPFVFSTAPSPLLAGALLGSLELIAAEPYRRETVRTTARRMRRHLGAAGIVVPPGESQIVPIVLGDVPRTLLVAGALQRSGFDVRPIRPPTVPLNSSRLRVSVNLRVSNDVIERFVSALSYALDQWAHDGTRPVRHRH